MLSSFSWLGISYPSKTSSKRLFQLPFYSKIYLFLRRRLSEVRKICVIFTKMNELFSQCISYYLLFQKYMSWKSFCFESQIQQQWEWCNKLSNLKPSCNLAFSLVNKRYEKQKFKLCSKTTPHTSYCEEWQKQNGLDGKQQILSIKENIIRADVKHD